MFTLACSCFLSFQQVTLLLFDGASLCWTYLCMHSLGIQLLKGYKQHCSRNIDVSRGGQDIKAKSANNSQSPSQPAEMCDPRRRISENLILNYAKWPFAVLKGPFPGAKSWALPVKWSIPAASLYSPSPESHITMSQSVKKKKNQAGSPRRSSSISHHPPFPTCKLKEGTQCRDKQAARMDANLHKTLFKRCNQSEVNASAGKEKKKKTCEWANTTGPRGSKLSV